MLDRTAIEAIIPHRHPFLLVDRVLEFEPGISAVGELDVVETAFWVPGHFPDYAVMPGVLIVEATKQLYQGIPAREPRRRLRPAFRPALIPPGA